MEFSRFLKINLNRYETGNFGMTALASSLTLLVQVSLHDRLSQANAVQTTSDPLSSEFSKKQISQPGRLPLLSSRIRSTAAGLKSKGAKSSSDIGLSSWHSSKQVFPVYNTLRRNPVLWVLDRWSEDHLLALRTGSSMSVSSVSLHKSTCLLYSGNWSENTGRACILCRILIQHIRQKYWHLMPLVSKFEKSFIVGK